MANSNENHLRDVAHVPKFDGSNFREWNFELRMMFQQLSLLGLVEGKVGHTKPIEVIITITVNNNVRVKHIYESNTCPHMQFKHDTCTSSTHVHMY